MPIYAYKCESCGHAKDILQKISDPVLTDCPACGAPAFKKQVTAAGFQLKGSGWYATDFRGGSPATGTAPSTPPGESSSKDSSPAKTEAAPAPAAATPSTGTSS
jgi:putative FmdB family regulatory protein